MAISVEVCLPSGKTACVSVDPEASVGELRRKAQEVLGGLELLLGPEGRLDERCSVKTLRSVTALARRAQLCSSPQSLAFALRKPDGTVVAWGHERCGGDTSKVQDQLVDVEQLVCNNFAFCALRGDGTVVCWGTGPCTRGASRVRRAQRLLATEKSFGALTSDGEVICWGAVEEVIDKVKEVTANSGAFCAIKEDGSVATWGDSMSGGDSREVQHRLRKVQKIHAARRSFFASTEDEVVVWGDLEMTVKDPTMLCGLRLVAENISETCILARHLMMLPSGEVLEHEEVSALCATADAFCALAKNRVVCWGAAGAAGATAAPALEAVALAATSGAFCAVGREGTATAWGDAAKGGNASAVQQQLRGVVQVAGSFAAFAALREDGEVVTWGHPGAGGNIGECM